MQTYFALAILSAAAAAADLSQHAQQEFMGYAGMYNWNYDKVEDMARGLENFQKNKARVQHLNETNRGVSFAINASANLDDEEWRKKSTGANLPHDAEGGRRLSHDPNARSLQGISSIDWVAAGKVSPVKNQGACGSCWAFGATLVQESMEAIQKDTAPVRLSEQEGVDCVANSSGCNGGWMAHYWAFSRDNGSQTNLDYPYEAATRECRNQTNKTVASRAASWGYARDSTTTMMQQLQQGPLSIAVAAGNECWRWYSDGILSSANNCPTSIDHAVVIVGLNIAGGDGGDGDGEQQYDRICRRATK